MLAQNSVAQASELCGDVSMLDNINLTSFDPTRLDIAVETQDVAYVIYKSGSTVSHTSSLATTLN